MFAYQWDRPRWRGYLDQVYAQLAGRKKASRDREPSPPREAAPKRVRKEASPLADVIVQIITRFNKTVL